MPIDRDRIDKSGSDSSLERSDDEMFDEAPTEPIKAIADLIFKESLLYSGFCFGGVSKSLVSVHELNAANLFVNSAPELQAGLNKLKVKIAEKIGCSKTFFELVFKTMIVHSTGAEVARHKDAEMEPKQFGTLFIQPPSTHTGGGMKVYRKLGAGEDEEEINLKFGVNFEASACKWQFGFISTEAEYEIAPILTGSRLMLVFAAVWSSDQGQRFHGPEQIDQIATQLELQRANGDFVVAFLRDSYKNLEGIGERALKHADRSLVRVLEAANERLERPFKVVLVSVAKHEWEKAGDYDELEWNSPGEFEQRWFDLDGNPWPYRSKADLEVMQNVLNPERKSLEQLWGLYVEKQLREVPTMDYDVLRTYRVTFRRTLVVLWYSDLTIERMAELEGWDAVFKTLIGKSPDSAALVSLFQLFKKKTNGIPYTRWRDAMKLPEDDTIRLIYDYIAQNSLLDVLPSYIVAFFKSKVAFMPIILASNEEIWKISLPVFSNLDDVNPFYLAGLLEEAQKEQVPEERCRKVLLEIIKSNPDGQLCFEFALHQTLALADEALMTTICDILVQKRRLVAPYLEKILSPEFAPLKEKFWTIFYSMLEQRIEILKDAIAKGSKPFDKNFPNLEVIFPKGSDESSWLLKPGNYCAGSWYDNSLTLRFVNSEKANQAMNQLKVYKSLFSTTTQFSEFDNKYHVDLKKTADFCRYQVENVWNKEELQALEKLKDGISQEPPKKKKKNHNK